MVYNKFSDFEFALINLICIKALQQRAERRCFFKLTFNLFSLDIIENVLIW